MVAFTMTKARARRASARSVPTTGKAVTAVKRPNNNNKKGSTVMSRHRATATAAGPLITSSSRKRSRLEDVPPDAVVKTARSRFVSVAKEVTEGTSHSEKIVCDLPVTSAEATESSVFVKGDFVKEDKENKNLVDNKNTGDQQQQLLSDKVNMLPAQSCSPTGEQEKGSPMAGVQSHSHSAPDTIFSPTYSIPPASASSGRSYHGESRVSNADLHVMVPGSSVAEQSTATSRNKGCMPTLVLCAHSEKVTGEQESSKETRPTSFVGGEGETEHLELVYGLQECEVKTVVGPSASGVHAGAVASAEALGHQNDSRSHREGTPEVQIAESDSTVVKNLTKLDTNVVISSDVSELECRDEGGEEAVQDDDEYDDFDPYLFIKRLPRLSEVVPSCRPHLLPKQTRRCPPVTLVLDLDETLVHSTLEKCQDADFSFPVHFNSQMHTVYVRRRPHLEAFMERVAQMFEIIVFTASQGVYAEQLLNILDPQRRLIRHRIFRDSCVYVEGNYLKDLSILGRDLAKVAIVDNSPQAFGFQVDNGIPIESWFDDKTDSALLCLLPFLESLVGVDDVRPVISKKFNLRDRIESAVEPPSLILR